MTACATISMHHSYRVLGLRCTMMLEAGAIVSTSVTHRAVQAITDGRHNAFTFSFSSEAEGYDMESDLL